MKVMCTLCEGCVYSVWYCVLCTACERGVYIVYRRCEGGVYNGDELKRDFANDGILGSRVCRQIFSNAHMAGDPDKNNAPPISGQIHI